MKKTLTAFSFAFVSLFAFTAVQASDNPFSSSAASSVEVVAESKGSCGGDKMKKGGSCGGDKMKKGGSCGGDKMKKAECKKKGADGKCMDKTPAK